MFVDTAVVKIKAGDGGDGVVSFRKEKFVDKGGPDGGDGGDGGDVVFMASRNQDTLVNFRYQKELKAEDGKSGFKRRQHGRSGQPLTIAVPVGTLINTEKGKTLADLTSDGQKVVIAQGGKGGFGNAHFKSSTRQAPKIAEKGEKGEELTLVLELKMIADVGLVGLPNAGKSTLLSVISNAKPDIANYPFTTITPNLGVVDIDKQFSLLVADIPGLIAGASEGKGLGDDFLRHVERTRILVHLIDVYNEDLVAAYKVIQSELKQYKTDLTKRPQIVVLTKVEGIDKEYLADRMAELSQALPKNTPLLTISAQSGQNVKELLYAIKDLVSKTVSKKTSSKKPKIPTLKLTTDDGWKVKKVKGGYQVSGKKIDRFASRTDFGNYHAVQRLRDIMRKMGIMHELERRGVSPGDEVTVGGHSFEY